MRGGLGFPFPYRPLHSYSCMVYYILDRLACELVISMYIGSYLKLETACTLMHDTVMLLLINNWMQKVLSPLHLMLLTCIILDSSPISPYVIDLFSISPMSC